MAATTPVKRNAADKLAAALRARATRGASSGKAARLQKGADLIELLFGHQTMDTSSFELSIMFILKIPGFPAVGNLSAQVRHWFPSAEYRRVAAAQALSEPIWGWSLEAGTLAGSTGYDSVTGFFMPGVSERGFGTGIGVPNYASVAFGEIDAKLPGQYNRGPYIGAAAEVVPLGVAGFSVGTMLYYRPAVVISNHLRPYYDKLRGLVGKVGQAVKHAGQWLIGRATPATTPGSRKASRQASEDSGDVSYMVMPRGPRTLHG